ncbi:hypothetical protein Tco_0459033 [Tanacetum coccineum]
MIGSLMYLTVSRPDIIFAVCACSRFQVTPKTSHLSAVKKIFRYLKGKPKLGLWYPRVSSFDLEAYSDSDFAGANLDRKSTTEGCQFLGRRLISWQCKKQTIVATSTTEAEYVAAANCHLDAKKKFVMYPRFISVFLDTQLKSVPVPLDHFPVNALTKDEGKQSERPSEPQLTPSPPHPSEVHVEPQSDPSPRPSPTSYIPDSLLESSGEIMEVTDQPQEIPTLEGTDQKLKREKPNCYYTPQSLGFKECSLEAKIGGKKALRKVMQKDVGEIIVSTDKEEVSTDRPNEGTDAQTDEVQNNGESLKKKEKGVELKDIERIKQLARDEEMARKVQEDWEAEEEVKKLAEEEATNAALIQDFDDIKARIEADRLLALRLQEEGEKAVHR